MPYLGNVPAENYSQVSYQDLTGGSGTSFTLDYPVGSAGEIEVFVNNVRQEPTVAYTVNGTALTMTGSVAATDDFYVVFQGKAEKSGTIPEKQTDGTYVFPDDVDVTGTITSDGLSVDGTATIRDDAVTTSYYSTDVASNVVTHTSNGTGAFAQEVWKLNDGGTPSERMRLTTTGLGIGTSSPSALLELSSSNPEIRLNDSDFPTYYASIRSNNTADLIFEADEGNSAAGTAIRFDVDGSEAMRVSGGNLLVGTTDTDPYNFTSGSGIAVRADGLFSCAATNNNAIAINRTGSDGSIAQFRKNGTPVGSIGAQSGIFILKGDANSTNGPLINIQNSTGGTCLTLGVHASSYGYIGDQSGSQVGIAFVSGAAKPVTSSNGGVADNLFDFGTATARWNDAYITNGVTTSSDANEKQQIAVLTDAEIAAAKRISAGFKTFKWNDAVEAKGDNARTHTGVIAQEVQTALEAEGLDAGNYAFWMSNTWWETQTEVPAVDEVVDEDGNVITEAKEAYTRTDTYDTLEEAPEGATERTRLGIRYPELLAFIGAATEQRLTSIEARLEALETP